MNELSADDASTLRGYLSALEFPRKQIAEAAGKSEADLSRMVNGGKELGLLEVLQIGRAIGRLEERTSGRTAA